VNTPLRDALDDLVTDVPAHVVPTDLGPRAWRAGRRRRVRRRLALSMLVAAAAILSVAVTPIVGDLRPLYLPADADDRGVGGYPQRIGHQWWIRTLPDRPGPVAALVEAGPDEGPILWYAVTETGHRWRLPARAGDIYPTISPDGGRIGYMRGDRGPYVIHDLVTGAKTEFAAVGTGLMPVTTPYSVPGQFPSFWSPDGRRIALNGALRDHSPGAVVLSVDGSVAFVPRGEGDVDKGLLAGWVGTDALLWVRWWSLSETSSGANVVATVTGLDGRPRRTITLIPASPWQGDTLAGQWTGTTSPDGREVLIIEEDSAGAGASVRRFSLLDGRETTGPAPVTGSIRPCTAGWTGSEPIVAMYDYMTATTAVVRDGELRTVVAVEPAVGARCFIWAGDALSGDARGRLLGTSTAWWTWWIREMTAALVLIGASVWAVLRWRRRRRYVTTERAPTGREPPPGASEISDQRGQPPVTPPPP
jgi:hypothetical protein